MNHDPARGEGRASLAPWIIKLLAGAFLMGSLAWAANQNQVNSQHTTDIATIRTQATSTDRYLSELKAQMDRIEARQEELLVEVARRPR